MKKNILMTLYCCAILLSACSHTSTTPKSYQNLTLSLKEEPSPKIPGVDSKQDSINYAKLLFIEALNKTMLSPDSFNPGPWLIQAAKFDTSSAFLAFEASKIYASVGEYRLSMTKLQKAKKLDSIAFGGRLVLEASLYRELGKYDSAQHYLEQAFKEKNGLTRDAIIEKSKLLTAQKRYSELAFFQEDTLLPSLNWPLQAVQGLLLLQNTLNNSEATERILGKAWAHTHDKNYLLLLAEYYWQIYSWQDIAEIAKIFLKEPSFFKGINPLLEISKLSPKQNRSKWMGRLGVAYQKQFSPQKAAIHLDELCDQGIMSWDRCAYARLQIRDTTLALAHFNRMEISDSLAVPGILLHSELLNLMGYKKESLERIEKAIYLQPNRSQLYFQKAWLLENQNQEFKAITLLDSLGETPTLSRKSWLFIGHIYSTLNKKSPDVGHLKASKQYFKKWLKKSPSDVETLFAISNILLNQDSISQAIKLMDQAIEIDSNHFQIANALAYVLIDKKIDLQKGFKLIEHAIEKSPNESVAYLDTRAWYYFRNSEFQKALDILLPISQSDDPMANDPEILGHLGQVYQAMGQLKNAKKIQDLLVRTFSTHPVLKQWFNDFPKIGSQK
jgi:tetratricopeptide (TPR) repeat protein